MWLHEDDASQFVNRSRWVLRDWRLAGDVQAKKRNGQWFFDRDSLRAARERMEDNYRMRRIVPGTGRGRFLSNNQMALWEEV